NLDLRRLPPGAHRPCAGTVVWFGFDWLRKVLGERASRLTGSTPRSRRSFAHTLRNLGAPCLGRARSPEDEPGPPRGRRGVAIRRAVPGQPPGPAAGASRPRRLGPAGGAPRGGLGPSGRQAREDLPVVRLGAQRDLSFIRPERHDEILGYSMSPSGV